MPELPEVETMTRELNRAVRGKVIRAVDIERAKLIRPLSPKAFRRRVVGLSFLRFRRRAKFILAELGRPARSSLQSPASSLLLLHMGMTGHLLYRDPKAEAQKSALAAAMADPMNRHVRVTFHFTDGTRLEYADVRMFGKVELLLPGQEATHPQLQKLGPEAPALAKDSATFCARLRARKTALKIALLDQTVIAGIGNIYADEALWVARLHPLLSTRRVTDTQCQTLARAIQNVLRAAIRARGTSIDDYRRVLGNKGRYGEVRKAYQRAGQPCARCGTLIQRLVVGGRGTHVCPSCQRRPGQRSSSTPKRAR